VGPAQQREGGDAREVASPLSAAEQAGLSKTKMGLSGPELGFRGRVKGVTEWASFSFLYLKKQKFQKYMSVLKIFENTPLSPLGRATGVLSPKQRATGP